MVETKSLSMLRRIRISKMLLGYGDSAYPYSSKTPGEFFFTTDSGIEFRARANIYRGFKMGSFSFDQVGSLRTKPPAQEVPKILNTIGAIFREVVSQNPDINKWSTLPSSPRRFSIYQRWMNQNLPPGYITKVDTEFFDTPALVAVQEGTQDGRN